MKQSRLLNSIIRCVSCLAVGASLLQTASAATYIWNVASPTANSWNVNANWLPDTGNPGFADTALFGDIGIGTDQFTVNNVVSVNTSIAALSYTNATAGTWHVTQIPAGMTLSVSGPVIVGGGPGVGTTTSAAMTDQGTFVVTGNAMTIGNGSTSTSPKAPGTLDLSGLANFVYSSSGGTIGLGTTGSRSEGNLVLASVSNNITAGTININGATGTASTPTFKLGAGTNIINVNSFNVGGGRSTTTLQFHDVTGGLRLRGIGGTDADRTTMVVGNRNTGGTGALTTTGNVILNGHPVDLKFATLTLGQMSRNSTTEANFNGVGSFEFDQGTVEATTISMGLVSGNSPTSRATGTLTIGASGMLMAGTISLANVSSGVAGSSASGTLNISGGTVNCVGSILKTTTTSSTGIVAVTSGRLSVGDSMGSSSNPIDSLSLSDATLTLRTAASAPVAVTELITAGTTNIINISSIPGIAAYPAQFQVIQYAGAIGGAGFDNNIGLGTLPESSPAFTAYLSNNTATLTVDLVVTSGPAPAQAITWAGAQSGAWDSSSLNWLAGAVPTNYNNAGDSVTFNDSASTSTVHLVTTTLTPGNITVTNTALTYTFTGNGKLSGSTGLTKQGSGTLNIANSGANDFLGGISVEGTLAFEQDLNASYANAISGPGAVVKNGPNTMTLSGINSFGGGLTVNNGTLRTGNINALGSVAVVTVNSGGTLVLGAVHTNAVVLAGGTLGASVGLNPTPMDLTAAPSTTSTLYMADPQNLITPTDGLEVNFASGTWHGSGTVVVATVLNDASADAGNGFRLRGTNVSDFSGTIVLSNRVKGELQTTVAGPFSPAGTGKVVLRGGSLTPNTLNGTYSELNLRNQSAGDTLLGNDVEVAGTGIVILNMVGTAPAGSLTTMGNLRIGGGQELGVNLNGTGADHPAVFQSVTLTGGNATFSPKTPGWNTTPQIGSDLVLNNVSESASSGLVMSGLRTLTLAGNNTYSGNTVVSNGTLMVNGRNSGAGSFAVYNGTVGGTGVISGPVTIGVDGTLSPGTSIGTLTISNVLTLAGTNVMEVSHTDSDRIVGLTSVALGGTLKIVVTETLTGGEVFKLIDAPPGGYAGNFTTYDLPPLDAPLAWDFSSVPVNGTLRVTGGSQGSATAFDGVSHLSDGNISLSITGAVNQTYSVLTTTNVALPFELWSIVESGTITASPFTVSDLTATNYPRRFYSVVTP